MDEVINEVKEAPKMPNDLVGLSLEAQIRYFSGVAKAKGWWPAEDLAWNPKNVFPKLFLIAGELVEAGEEHRNGHALDEIYYGVNGKPEGFTVELADAYIRLMDLVGGMGLTDTFVRALKEKAAYNADRPYRHGNKLI